MDEVSKVERRGDRSGAQGTTSYNVTGECLTVKERKPKTSSEASKLADDHIVAKKRGCNKCCR